MGVILVMMTEPRALQRISAYVAENRMIAALEAEVKYMALEANEQVSFQEGPGKDFDPEPPDSEEKEVRNQRLYAIYDDEPLVFEKDMLADNVKMLAQDPLEEIDLGKVNNIGKNSFDRNLAHIGPCSPPDFDLAPTPNSFRSLYLHFDHGFQWDREDLSNINYGGVDDIRPTG